MISKKPLIIFTYVLFVSLCSPIKTETTKTEHIARVLGYGFWGIAAGFIPSMETCEIKGALATLYVSGSMATATGMDTLFAKGDRPLIDINRGFVCGVAGVGGVVGGIAGVSLGRFFGYENNDNVLIALCLVSSAMGAAAGSFVSDYAVEKDICHELKKLIARNKKESE